jgi:hypothetical protein
LRLIDMRRIEFIGGQDVFGQIVILFHRSPSF